MTRRRAENPVAIVPRAFEEMRADYAAGKTSRFQRTRTGIALVGSGADYHIRNEYQYFKTIEYARDMARNDTVFGAIVERSIRNLLHDGFGFDPQTGDSELDADLKAGFTEFAADPQQCDVSGRFTLHELAEKVAWGVKVDGGLFVLPHNGGQLQLVEAHRCRTPSATKRNVVIGVFIDEWRRPKEYWFTKEELDPWRAITKVSEINRYPARDEDGEELVWHIYDPCRVSQTRGITTFAPIFEVLGMFDDMQFAAVVKSLVSQCFTFIRELPLGPPLGKRAKLGPQRTESTSDGEQRLVEDLSPGQEITGRPGEIIKAFTPNVPNAEFFEHTRFVLQLACATQNLPLACFLLDGKETNFSGQRFANDQAKIGWKREQGFYARTFHRRAYRCHVRARLSREPALRTQLNALGERAFFHMRVNLPCWPYMQPVQDIEAKRREREALLTSPRRQVQERGADWPELTTEIVADNELAILKAIKAAQKIKAATGVAIDPVKLLYLDTKQPLALVQAPTRPATEPAAEPTTGVPSG